MKTATIRDLRYDFPKIEAWLKGGQEVLITKHAKPLARIVQDRARKPARAPLPDYRARVRLIWGDRVFTAAEVKEMRTFETGEP